MRLDGAVGTTSERRIRWGILGTGHIADVFAGDLALLTDEAELAAVASRAGERAARFAATHGFARSYGSYSELAADPEVDVCYVASPHPDHYPTARCCLEAGKAVLVEKPLTTNPDDTAELISIARDRGLFLMEALWTRTNPLMRQVAELVATQAIGPVRHASLNFGFHFAGTDDHRLLNPALGGGAILDLGVYPAHIAQLLLGEPAAITGAGHLAGTGVDAHATAVLNYPATSARPAATAAITASVEADMDNAGIVHGETGRLEIDHVVKPTSVRLVRSDPQDGDNESSDYVTQLPGGGYTLQAQDVMQAIRSGTVESELVPWRDTLAVARTLARWRDVVDQSVAAREPA
jgi:predicted dehydrogenase